MQPVLRETALTNAPADRPGHVIGLDLGGTKLLGAIASTEGGLIAEMSEPTGPDAFAQVVAMGRALMGAAGVAGVAHLALGVPGAVAPDGRVFLAPNVHFGTDPRLGAALTLVLGCEVSVWNDCNAAAYGEYDGQGSLAFVALGTGIGIGLILNGHLVTGRSGAAGEIAYLPFGSDPYARARAHPEGGFEALVGTRALRAALPGSPDVREIFARVEAGDAAAAAVVERLTDDLAAGLAATIALVDPGLVVLGGGIGSRAGLAERLVPKVAALVPTPCTIRASRFGDRAGLMGALALARRLARQEVA